MAFDNSNAVKQELKCFLNEELLLTIIVLETELFMCFMLVYARWLFIL